MSHIASYWAINQTGISLTAKLVLIVLADYHNSETGGCFPSKAALAEKCCCTERTVMNATQELEDAGLLTTISRQETSGRQRSNQYILNVQITGDGGENFARGRVKKTAPLEQVIYNQDTTPTELEDPLISIFDVPEEPPVENSKAFWDQAVGMLTSLGVAKATVNPFIGRCLKMTGQDQDKVLEAIQAAVDSEPSNAVPYIVAILGGKKNKKTAKQKEIDDAFAQLHEASERRKARWKEQYGTEYGVLPDTGTGGGEDLQLLQPEPHQGHSLAVSDRSSGSGAVPRRSPASVVRPRKGHISESEISADDF